MRLTLVVVVNQEQRGLQEVSIHGEHLGDVMLQAVLTDGVGIQWSGKDPYSSSSTKKGKDHRTVSNDLVLRPCP